MEQKSFPIVWAVRKKIGHTGTFSDDQNWIEQWSGKIDNAETKSFNIVEDWCGLCAFFNGWGPVDHNRANKLREGIFRRNNYSVVISSSKKTL